MKILQSIVSEFLYLTIISFIFLVRITPRPIAITVGRLLGLAFWALVPYYRKLVKIQMKNALGSGYSRLLPIKAFMNFGMMVDQRHQKKYGLICDLLGMPAITTPAPAFIALKGDAIILPVSSSKGQGKTYRVRFEKPIDPREFGTIDDNTERLSDGAPTEAEQKISDSIQAWLTSVIRTYPDQWLWLHSRWVRRKYMKKIFKEGLDFREFVFRQAKGIKQAFKSQG